MMYEDLSIEEKINYWNEYRMGLIQYLHQTLNLALRTRKRFTEELILIREIRLNLIPTLSFVIQQQDISLINS